MAKRSSSRSANKKRKQDISPKKNNDKQDTTKEEEKTKKKKSRVEEETDRIIDDNDDNDNNIIDEDNDDVAVEEDDVSSEEEDVKDEEAEVDDHEDTREADENNDDAQENDDDDDDDNQHDDTTMTPPPPPPMNSDGRYRNKQRCLVLCSRGVTARFRHLLEDLRTLMPHHKKESKLDAGEDGVGRAVNDIAEMKSCNTFLFLECRKRQDAYMWMGKTGSSSFINGNGPSVRFHVSNIHTMDELRLTGNCMKGSRPLLTFDESFTRIPHLKLLKELFVDVFGTPRGHPKSKPFVDRTMSFFYADKKIWVRNYQIVEEQASNAKEAHQSLKEIGQSNTTSLVEIGPRFVLNPIRIFRGSFGGQTLYQNRDFISPNEIRAEEKRQKGNTYAQRKFQQKKRKQRSNEIVIPEDPLQSVFT